MDLSIREVATVLGKSERQVRYLVRQGSLPARKEANRWRIASEDLPIDDSRRETLRQRLDAARGEIESALDPVAKALAEAGDDKGEANERYSVRRLSAFETGREIYRDLLGASVAEPARTALFETLVQLTQGCHAFHSEEKAEHFRSARRHAASAIAHLFLAADEGGEPFGERLEQELIPKISGLVASQEKGRRRSQRFERFGATKSRQ